MSRATSYRQVSKALQQLVSDQQLEPVESKRARIVAMCQGQVDRALTLKRRLTSDDGRELGYADQPDLKAANQAMQMLIQVEGLAAK